MSYSVAQTAFVVYRFLTLLRAFPFSMVITASQKMNDSLSLVITRYDNRYRILVLELLPGNVYVTVVTGRQKNTNFEISNIGSV
jgi:hypothetical protein